MRNFILHLNFKIKPLIIFFIEFSSKRDNHSDKITFFELFNMIRKNKREDLVVKLKVKNKIMKGLVLMVNFDYILYVILNVPSFLTIIVST